MRFMLGCPAPEWLDRTTVDLFLSHSRLSKRKRLPRATCTWAVDSGAFTELTRHGRWTVDPIEYAASLTSYARAGGLAWAAPQDYLCAPPVLDAVEAATGRRPSVAEQQERTVQSVLVLRRLTHVHVIPVLQGWAPDDYLAHVELYASAGVDLHAEQLVGVGSIATRPGAAVAAVVEPLAQLGLALHGFGVAGEGAAAYGWALASGDSMSWSANARINPPMDGCPHRRCSYCLRFALAWRARVIARTDLQLPLPLG